MDKVLPEAYAALKQEFSLLSNEPMACHTSFKVGGPADLFAAPGSRNELISIIERADQLGIPVTLMGSGTNLLVKDGGIRGLVVTTRMMNKNIALGVQGDGKHFISASAGVVLASLARASMDQGLDGFSFCAGIPGTVGGAVMMNAGTLSGTIAGPLASLEVLGKDGKVQTIDSSKLVFSHRKTSFNGLGSKVLLLGARFFLVPGDKKEIRTRWLSLLEKRNSSQPGGLASAGCFFKNPQGARPAGFLIDKAGLKGKQFGNAMVSRTHGNFIVNLGGATAQEILTLKEMIEDEVKKKFNVDLKPEVKIEGE